MLKILKSLVVIFAVVAVTAGATSAYFSDQAVVSGNTFSTGVLEIRVNGQETMAGFNYGPAAPGGIASQVFTLSNYGPPHFLSGPSTLAAADLLATVVNVTGDNDLADALVARLYANAGWTGCSNPVNFVPGKGCEVYNGALKSMNQADILKATQWGSHPSLVPGNSLTMTLEVELPNTGSDQTALMDKSVTFDLAIDAYNPRVTP